MKAAQPRFLVFAGACLACGLGGFFLGRSVEGAAKAAAAHRPVVAVKGTGGLRLTSDIPLTITDLLADPRLFHTDDLARWAKGLSPEERAQSLTQLQAMPGGGRREVLVNAILEAWAAQQPQAALQWVKDNPAGAASTNASLERFVAAIAGFATADLNGAFAVVNGLSADSPHDRAYKDAALAALEGDLVKAGNFSGAAQLVGELSTSSSGGDSVMKYFALAQGWALTAPQDAANWAASISDPSQRSFLQKEIAKTWAANDPVAAANWALQTDQGLAAQAKTDNSGGGAPGRPSILESPGVLLANAITAWLQFDLTGPENYLAQLPDSAVKAPALGILALHVSEDDPTAAMQLANSIGDPELRQSVAIIVAKKLFGQDPAKFNDWLDGNTDLTDDQKQALTQSPSPGQNMNFAHLVVGFRYPVSASSLENDLTGNGPSLLPGDLGSGDSVLQPPTNTFISHTSIIPLINPTTSDPSLGGAFPLGSMPGNGTQPPVDVGAGASQ